MHRLIYIQVASHHNPALIAGVADLPQEVLRGRRKGPARNRPERDRVVIKDEQPGLRLSGELRQLLCGRMVFLRVGLHVEPLWVGAARALEKLQRQGLVQEDVASPAGVYRGLRRRGIAGYHYAAVGRVEAVSIRLL